ncbi:MAG: glycosyltransferase, partial [Chloroflexi bacterium]|nr:glycosyltransferase [Chloroflexota bacterium]
KAAKVDFVDTGTAAYRREAFMAVGGFDPKYVAEDIELAFRLAENGARLVFAPKARVRHRHADSLARYLFKKLQYGYFRTAVYQRHPTKWLGDSYTPPTMGLQIVIAGLLWLLAVPALFGSRWARLALAVLGLTYASTTAPLALRAARSDPPLTPLVPVLALARSTTQGLGLAAGLAATGWRRLTEGTSSGQ